MVVECLFWREMLGCGSGFRPHMVDAQGFPCGEFPKHGQPALGVKRQVMVACYPQDLVEVGGQKIGPTGLHIVTCQLPHNAYGPARPGRSQLVDYLGHTGFHQVRSGVDHAACPPQYWQCAGVAWCGPADHLGVGATQPACRCPNRCRGEGTCGYQFNDGDAAAAEPCGLHLDTVGWLGGGFQGGERADIHGCPP